MIHTAVRARNERGRTMKRARHQRGSVVFDKRRKTWNLLTSENGKRRSKLIGTKQQYPTKSAAWEAAEKLRSAPAEAVNSPTVSTLVEQYRAEKMPQRFSTRRSYECWINGHILPKWGACPLAGLQARPVELWLDSLDLSPKSRVHIRGLLRKLWDHSMWRGDIPTQRNPIELVSVKAATTRAQRPRSLTTEDFKKFVTHLDEPFRTIALVSVCLGLRISECLALRWGDVDWFILKLTVERGIVMQVVGDVKTTESRRQMSIDSTLLAVLATWRQGTQFSADTDWIFASPIKLGRLPWSYPWVWRIFQNAAADAGVGKLATHTMRHSYRSWLDAAGTSIAVQQKLMRHADIRTTLNVYGDVVTDEMQKANTKVAEMVLTDRVSDRNRAN
jgi:integrase